MSAIRRNNQLLDLGTLKGFKTSDQIQDQKCRVPGFFKITPFRNDQPQSVSLIQLLVLTHAI